MNTTFDFRLIELDGPLSQQVQAVWSASVSIHSEPVTKPLFSDGASGAFIILKGEVIYHDQTYKQGVHWIPVKKQAQFITMSAGLEMVGFRFQAGISKNSVSVFQNVSTSSQNKNHNTNAVDKLQDALVHIKQADRLSFLCDWLQQHIQQATPSNALLNFIRRINHKTEIQGIEKHTPLSLRQIERQFKSQIGLTPKYYQRLIRVKTAIGFIRQCPTINLVDLATEAGFSDQAHMNREFRMLAGMTPKEYQVSKQ
ncbi:MAG: methylphosphotriester-DNA--protein-cysteine methyltransferase [Oceanicoccus sp.]|jgi:methylphosphotriester-DNA--protein-cysteine methyltransferase